MQRKDPPPAAARALASLGQNLLERQQWAKAEQVARDYLAICEKTQPEAWDTLSARALLGGALLGQRKVRDAQPLVVAGYDALKKQSETRVLDNNAKDEETPWSVAYAVCYVQASTLRKGLVLKVGSDDQSRVYLNRKKIYENIRPRALSLDEDTISDVELQVGLNVVVFKVVNDGGGWGGSLRFTDKDDQPVQGIKITLEPD
jgi:hypothetical protein